MLPDNQGAFIKFSPPESDKNDLSKYYDCALSSAEFTDGYLYIGDKNHYICYRNNEAPRGYDVLNIKKIEEKENFYLIDTSGTKVFSKKELNTLPLEQVILKIRPDLNKNYNLPSNIFALVKPALYKMLSRYFRNHNLNYKLAKFISSKNQLLILYEIFPRSNAPTGEIIPAFVLSYLCDLPFCSIFTKEYSLKNRHILVEWKMRNPCMLENIADIFPENSITLFTTSIDFPNMIISPSPTFFSGDDLIKINISQTSHIKLSSVNNDNGLKMEIPVRIIPDTGRLLKSNAIILDKIEKNWVQKLLYRLPYELFESVQVCFGKDYGILKADELPIDLIPFGRHMQKFQGSNLYIPIGTKLMPDLPYKPIADNLNLKQDTLTFLCIDFRLDVLEKEFSPLSLKLISESNYEIEFQVQPVKDLLEIKWKSTDNDNQNSFINKFVKQNKISKRLNQEQIESKKPENIETIIRNLAAKQLKSDDFIGAAMCYALSDDKLNAARYFQKVINSLKSG
ncbi:MAG: hypothetical protein OMM_03181 [Candidatus Magnetoglobus multicellularis str. Araruama]|uniref:FtsH ternary system domain-containing protein n=1 Tax=Candidatus Magnetoglobus multicellularis str. Araruama TaxID=890399 RepID=A0A1V1P704_9BACT|nr:MAG: hypothetical protein OMM_03181 [Candidatus Magnetoglobus multicellularis str. Araruama]